MKSLSKYLTEARQIEYQAALNDVRDSEDLPITISILVDKDDQKNFEKWLEDQQDNLFSHAAGGDVEY
jgi:hypothetical protein